MRGRVNDGLLRKHSRNKSSSQACRILVVTSRDGKKKHTCIFGSGTRCTSKNILRKKRHDVRYVELGCGCYSQDKYLEEYYKTFNVNMNSKRTETQLRDYFKLLKITTKTERRKYKKGVAKTRGSQ